MPSDTCPNCGYAATRQNPDCGDHPAPESHAAKHLSSPVHATDQILITGKEYLEALERSKAEGAREELEALDRDAMRVLHKDGFRDCIDAGIVRRHLKALRGHSA